MTRSQQSNKKPELVVGITGASGALYAVRLLDVLLASGANVHLAISPAATQVIETELAINLDLDDFEVAQLLEPCLAKFRDSPVKADDNDQSNGKIFFHHFEDYTAGIASGSFLTDGMVICPCSMGTLASLACGQSTNLIHRAAHVHLKERRKLIVVPRETPLGTIQLENMKRLADAGAVMLPAMPGFYHHPTTIEDLVDFVVARLCDQLGIAHHLTKRWGERQT